MSITRDQKRTLIILGVAALPAAAVAIFRPHWIIGLLLCLLSCAISSLELIAPVKSILRGKRFGEPLLIALLAVLASIISGAFASAALSLIIYRLSLMYVQARYKRAERMIMTRAELSSLKAYIPEQEERPELDLRLHKALDRYLAPALLVLAALYASLLPLLSPVPFASALRNAAVLLSLGGAFSLFAPFTLADFAAAVRAAECGLLFGRGAVNKAAKASLLYADAGEAADICGITVYSADANALGAKSILFLAATAYSYSGGETALKLAEAYGSFGKPLDRSAVSEAQELEGLGVIAKIRGTTVCVGSAAFMNRIGLPVMPFSDYGTTIHVGVNGRYAGRLCLKNDGFDDAAFVKEAERLGLTPLLEPADIAARRNGGKTLIFASCGSFPTGTLSDGDARLVLGAYGEDADIFAAGCSRKAPLNAFAFAKNAGLIKNGCFVFSGAAKALVLLLAALGLMPLWLAFAADAAAAAFVCSYALRVLDMEESVP